jgi:hypothetical protein
MLAQKRTRRVKPQGRTTTNAFPTVVVLLIIVTLICLLSVERCINPLTRLSQRLETKWRLRRTY